MMNNLIQFSYLLHALSIYYYSKRYSFSRSNPYIMQAKLTCLKTQAKKECLSPQYC